MTDLRTKNVFGTWRTVYRLCRRVAAPPHAAPRRALARKSYVYTVNVLVRGGITTCYRLTVLVDNTFSEQKKKLLRMDTEKSSWYLNKKTYPSVRFTRTSSLLAHVQDFVEGKITLQPRMDTVKNVNYCVVASISTLYEYIMRVVYKSTRCLETAVWRLDWP